MQLVKQAKWNYLSPLRIKTGILQRRLHRPTKNVDSAAGYIFM
jgi:hypothetical protein